MLVREYLNKVLYQAEKGYFSRSSPILRPDFAAVNFAELRGQADWVKTRDRLLVDASKEQKSGDWLTQSELFAPHFSNVLVDWAVKQGNLEGSEGQVRFLEIGGGNGTNALHMLNHLRARYPRVYERSSFTVCEISSTLADVQERNLIPHKDRCRVVNRDFLKWNESDSGEQWVILAIEVLDNLPHDKLVYKPSSSTPARVEDIVSFDVDTALSDWSQVLVEEWGVETSEPLQDPLAIQAAKFFVNQRLDHNPSLFSWPSSYQEGWYRLNRFLTTATRRRYELDSNAVFVPSSMMEFLRTVDTHFANHLMLIADFAFLPFPSIRDTQLNRWKPGTLLEGRNIPIVSGGEEDRKDDFPSYIVPNSNYDIFFQTNFENLSRAYSGMVRGSTQAKYETNREFMERNLMEDSYRATCTSSGYNPLVADFQNVSFFTGVRQA